MFQQSQEERDQRHSKLFHSIKTLFQIENLSGLILFSSLGRILQLSDALDNNLMDGQDLSAPRWRLLLHLFMAEQLGKTDGITPTELSHFQQVSKNTISALLRGLEEQGMIVREMDAKDLRIFRIRLSDLGRQTILNTAPKRIEGMNELLGDLSQAEVEQLTSLLTKLRHSLEKQVCKPNKDQTCP